jgi:hypothetical protein
MGSSARPQRSPYRTRDRFLRWRFQQFNQCRQTENTRPYRWLVCNALRFGFTPYAAEPWHWEFHSV